MPSPSLTRLLVPAAGFGGYRVLEPVIRHLAPTSPPIEKLQGPQQGSLPRLNLTLAVQFKLFPRAPARIDVKLTVTV